MFLKPRWQSSHILHLAEEALNDVAHGIDVLVMGDWSLGIAFRWDHRQCAPVCDLASYFGAAIGFVRDDGQRWFRPVQKGIHDVAVMDVSAGDLQPVRATLGVYGHVNFACATAA